MLLFADIKKVKKFFDILYKLERHSVQRYKGYNKKSPDWIPCSKEVFINRTINKWFSGKSLIYYAEDKDTGIEYKRYVTITKLAFLYNWSLGDLQMYFFDYSQPQKGIIDQKITHNDVISAEGKWCDNTKEHEELLKKFLIEESLQDYNFKTFAYNKRGKAKEGIITVQAKTLKEAYKQRDKEIKSNPNLLIGDLIENY